MSSDHYPPSPAAVPDGLTAAPPSYRRNGWLAVFGLLGFVVAYAALTGWFAYKAVTLLHGAWRGGPRAVLDFATGAVAAFLALFLGKAMFFVRHHADRARLEITAADEPRLFAFLQRLAAETGARLPHRVYLSPRVNAAVFYDLSLLNLLIPSRKNLEIGVGLVNALTLAELKAVLAHELGHFAQRSMAVGRWVYIAQQIAGHIVAKRDIFDRFLRGLSNVDIRVAWIGWGLRLIVWSIRSVLDSLFGVIVLAERALSREMELQADLVSVSVSGSDALVHALRKLPPADSAWDTALELFAGELQAGRLAPDVCAMQSRVIECTRRVLADPLYGGVPPVPADERARHRVFTAGLAQPPQMWSTHPPSHVREDNAKRRYVAAELDDRPAWLVFADADAVRRRITGQLADLVGRPANLEAVDLATSLKAVERRFDKLFLDPSYRGAYLGRAITRSVDGPTALCGPACADVEAVQSALRDLYPASLSTTVERARALAGELAQLEAIRRGVATAPGGVIRYGGQEFRRRELGDVIARAKQDHEQTLTALREHDVVSRSAHRDAAALLGRGWPAYLEGLHALLHYAEHTEANVDDAGGHLRNVFEIVTADGKISRREARRLIVSGGDLQHVLQTVFEQRDAVRLPAEIAARLEVESWRAALPTEFELHPPNEESIANFMDVVDSWFGAFSGALGALRGATLETLLATESHLASALLGGVDPGDAPEPARIPQFYVAFQRGQERERQLRLDLWDRFMLADGVGPGLARLTVAGAVVSLVVGFGGSVGAPTLVIHNGLARDVVVTVADQSVTVAGHGRRELTLAADAHLPVRAATVDGRAIEAFEADAGDGGRDYVYSVGGASPMFELEVRYASGHVPTPRQLGAPRWLTTDADYILVEPPTSGKTGTARTVLWSPPDLSPFELLGALDPADHERVALFRARWEPLDGLDAQWLMFAAQYPAVADVVQARRAEGDASVVLGRVEQDASKGDEHRAVCERHQAAADADAGDVDAAYLALRCLDDADERRDVGFIELHRRHPAHPWAAQAAAFAHFQRDELDQAIAALDVALRGLPAMAEQNLVVSARLRRRAAPDQPPDLAPLAADSRILRFLLSRETGEAADGEAPVIAYQKLEAGEFAAALEHSAPGERARVLRLVAASEGADPQLLELVRGLASDDGVDRSTVWTALAHAARHGLPTEPFVERVRRDEPELADRMLGFVDRELLLGDLELATTVMRALHPELRGQAAVMGLITLGRDAPDAWRLDARHLLFPGERPRFAPPAPPRAEPPPEPPPPAPRRGARRPK